MKIWVLFSIANMYDQPEHNLEAWWVWKPSHRQIVCDAFGYSEEENPKWDDPKVGDHLKVKALLEGKEVRIGECDYYLREIPEGRVLSEDDFHKQKEEVNENI